MKRYKKKFIKESIIKELSFKSFTEAVKMNSPFYVPGDRVFYNSEGRQIFLEGISFEFKDKGEIIVFSTDVNAMVDERGFLNKIKGFFKGKFQTVINRLRRNPKLAKILSQFEDIQAYSVGNFFRGKYFDRENDKLYDEKSLSVEIIGIPEKLIVPIAEEIAKEFNQKEVLVKEYESGRIYLVDTFFK